jgi:hypothetical protein
VRCAGVAVAKRRQDGFSRDCSRSADARQNSSSPALVGRKFSEGFTQPTGGTEAVPRIRQDVRRKLCVVGPPGPVISPCL